MEINLKAHPDDPGLHQACIFYALHYEGSFEDKCSISSFSTSHPPFRMPIVTQSAVLSLCRGYPLL